MEVATGEELVRCWWCGVWLGKVSEVFHMDGQLRRPVCQRCLELWACFGCAMTEASGMLKGPGEGEDVARAEAEADYWRGELEDQRDWGWLAEVPLDE